MKLGGKHFCMAATLSAFLAGPAHAVLPDEVLADPVLEARARNLSQELRCLVCQNQSIDDSSAPLARDLRLLVRERLSKGDTDGQVIDYLVARYGSYVLLKPPLQKNTLILWIGPALILVLAGGVFAVYVSRADRPKREAATQLTEAERQELASLLEDEA